MRLYFPEVAFSSESSNHLWHSQLSFSKSESDSKSKKTTLLGLLELLELLGFVESTLVGGWRFEVRGKTFVMRWCGVSVKPRESKILNTLKVSSKFERVRPEKVVLGGLLEMIGPTLVRGWRIAPAFAERLRLGTSLEVGGKYKMMLC